MLAQASCKTSISENRSTKHWHSLEHRNKLFRYLFFNKIMTILIFIEINMPYKGKLERIIEMDFKKHDFSLKDKESLQA